MSPICEAGRLKASRRARSRVPSRPLRGALAAALVLCAGVASACEPANGCAVDCVATVVVNPASTNTRIDTTVKTKVGYTVYSDAHRTVPVPTRADATLATVHTLGHDALTPNRTYWYRVRATDERAHAFTQVGSFDTQQRTVTVTVTSITLIDDSDGAGTGELTFGLKVGASDFG
ncbi:MAG: hypothetical protein JWM47_2183, partial [Acidimicrobiales bacterium]|nr:hypothetical protein [Acidimicrobiales bacterium]